MLFFFLIQKASALIYKKKHEYTGVQVIIARAQKLFVACRGSKGK